MQIYQYCTYGSLCCNFILHQVSVSSLCSVAWFYAYVLASNLQFQCLYGMYLVLLCSALVSSFFCCVAVRMIISLAYPHFLSVLIWFGEWLDIGFSILDSSPSPLFGALDGRWLWWGWWQPCWMFPHYISVYFFPFNLWILYPKIKKIFYRCAKKCNDNGYFKTTHVSCLV